MRVPFDAASRLERLIAILRNHLELDRASWAFALALTTKWIGLTWTTGFSVSAFAPFICLGGMLLLASLAAPVRGRRRIALLVAVDLVLTLVACVDLVLLRLNDSLLDLTTLGRVIHFTTDLPMFALLRTLTPLQLALLWLDFPLLFLAGGWWHPAPTRRRLRAFATAFGSALLLLSGGALLDPFWSDTSWQLPQATGHAGVAMVQLFRIADSLQRTIHPRHSSPKDLAQLTAFAHSHQSGERGPGGKPLNVLIVQVESLQSPVIGLRVEGREVSPNLNRLASSWIYFDRFYSQVGVGHTSDAEWLALCSQYPVDGDVAFFRYSHRELPCLPALARKVGASTVAFHGAVARTWNRQRMYPAIGFDRFFSTADYQGAPKMGMGIADPWLLPQSIYALAQHEPFLGHVVTLTSHAPFEGLPSLLPLGKLEGTDLGKYLNAVHIADAGLGAMLDALAAKGLLDRTIVAIYGDHAGISRFDPAVRAQTGWTLADRAEWAEYDAHIPLFLHVPGAASKVEHSVGGQIDLAPTLARAAHYPTGDTVFLGRDLLAGPAEPVVFPTGAAYSNGFLFDPELPHRHRCYSMEPLTERPESDCEELARHAARELSMGRELVETDSFREVLPPHVTNVAARSLP